MLPDVRPVISIASSIGTPAAIRPEKVREKRASATFWTMSPIFNGNLSLRRSHCSRPRVAFFQRRKAQTVPTDHGDDDVAALGDQVRERHGELRDRRQLAAEVLEDPLEDRHEERDQRDQHDEREADDHVG